MAKVMSGRFFKQQHSASDTESSDAESDIQPVKTAPAPAYTFSEDEEEDVKRVVRSAKEKRFGELETLIKQSRNHKKNKDLAKVLSGYEEINTASRKAKAVLEKDGDQQWPRIYLRYLSELDEFIGDLWDDKEGKRNMSKPNSKALGILRQKVRKYINESFKSDIDAYRVNPDTGSLSDDSDDEGDSDESGDEQPVTGNRFLKGSMSDDSDDSDAEESKPKSKFLKGASDSEDSDSSWGSSEEESDMSSDDEGGDLRSKFLKQDTKVEPVKEPARKKKKESRKERAEPEEGKDDEEEEKWEKVGAGVVPQAKQKLFSKTDKLNHEEVLNKIYEILAMRGKKKIRKSEQIRMFHEILIICQKQNLGPAMEIKVLYGTITSLFDYNPNTQSCIRTSLFMRCLRYIIQLIVKLCENSDISIGDHIPEDQESFVQAPFKIHGCVLSLIERMDSEFTKLLQASDPHTPEYVERLRFERIVTQIITRFQQYLEEGGRGTKSELCRIYLLRIDHVYYKFDRSIFPQQAADKKDDSVSASFEKLDMISEENEKKEDDKQQMSTEKEHTELKTEEEKAADGVATVAEEAVENGEAGTGEQPVSSKKTLVDKFNELLIEVTETGENSVQLLDRLCKFIYTNDATDRIRTQAILFHIYHHALHDNWYEARDLMLISQLQNNIHKADIPLQIIYNRALVQIGLCAFRHGFIKDAHTDLLDIHLIGRAKELLAQGILPKPQMHERTPEQEKQEKARLLPFHKQINLELLECVYLVSAMLLEIPDVAANEFNVKKKIITRPFYNQLRKNEEQPLVGLPESMREHAIAASKAMKIGNWKQCRDFVINDKMNAKVWNLFHQPDKVRQMLVQKIKEESLRAYLFTYSHIYDSISLTSLSEMFELEYITVHSIIAKMIINEELMASMDEPTQSLAMHRTEPSRIQGLSLQLAEKISFLLEHNEKLYELKQMGVQSKGQQNRKYYDDMDKKKGDRNFKGNMRNKQHGGHMHHNQNRRGPNLNRRNPNNHHQNNNYRNRNNHHLNTVTAEN